MPRLSSRKKQCLSILLARHKNNKIMPQENDETDEIEQDIEDDEEDFIDFHSYSSHNTINISPENDNNKNCKNNTEYMAAFVISPSQYEW
jgi:hypothetical protein